MQLIMKSPPPSHLTHAHTSEIEMCDLYTATNQKGSSLKQQHFISVQDAGKVAQTQLQLVHVGDQ